MQAQRVLAQAESDYYRNLVNYNKDIMTVHLRKGSLLEYNGVYLAEGPWPAKACFDARRRARAREAALHLNYGFTKPEEFSRGPMNQQMDSEETAAAAPGSAAPPAPAGEPLPPPANVPVPPGPLPPPPTPAAPSPPPAAVAPPAAPATTAPSVGQPQPPEAIPVEAQGSVAARLPTVPDNRMGAGRVNDVSWVNPIREDREAVGPNADPFARPMTGGPVMDQQPLPAPVPQSAMPKPPQPAGPLPVQPPTAQSPAQQPGPAATAEDNPLREVAERAVDEGRGLRD